MRSQMPDATARRVDPSPSWKSLYLREDDPALSTITLLRADMAAACRQTRVLRPQSRQVCLCEGVWGAGRGVWFCWRADAARCWGAKAAGRMTTCWAVGAQGHRLRGGRHAAARAQGVRTVAGPQHKRNCTAAAFGVGAGALLQVPPRASPSKLQYPSAPPCETRAVVSQDSGRV